jgi:hypothetical protein
MILVAGGGGREKDDLIISKGLFQIISSTG